MSLRWRWFMAAVATGLTGAALCPRILHPPPPDVPGPADLQHWLSVPDHATELTAFDTWLFTQGVGGIVPTTDLWRQGTDWRALAQPPFAVPPRDLWPGIVPTLVVLRDEVIPLVGPVEVVSGFRTFRYNQLAGGAPGSRHRWFEALDVLPRAPWPRRVLHHRLVGWWRTDGPGAQVGLGLYEHTRFHVDTWRHRTW